MPTPTASVVVKIGALLDATVGSVFGKTTAGLKKIGDTMKELASRSQELKALPNQIVRRIDDAIQVLSENPLPPGSVKVKGRVGDGWRVRVGDYRILYTVDHEARVIRIYRIRHRREAYR